MNKNLVLSAIDAGLIATHAYAAFSSEHPDSDTILDQSILDRLTEMQNIIAALQPKGQRCEVCQGTGRKP